MKEQVKIFPASPEDVREIQEVFYKTWLDTYPNEELGITVDDIKDIYKDSFTKEGLKKRAKRIADPPEGETLFVSEMEGKIVGVCRVVIHADKNQLKAMYVLPEYQSKGVGQKLWEYAQKLFDSDKDIIVQVSSYNERAMSFYRGLGFEDTGKELVDEEFRMESGAAIPETEMVIKASDDDSKNQ